MRKVRKQVIDGGYTGKISNVNADLISAILEKKYTPVISPIAMSEEFEFLNVDGDRAAANVAGHVKTDKVLFITNVDGLLMDEKLVENHDFIRSKRTLTKDWIWNGKENSCCN